MKRRSVITGAVAGLAAVGGIGTAVLGLEASEEGRQPDEQNGTATPTGDASTGDQSATPARTPADRVEHGQESESAGEANQTDTVESDRINAGASICLHPGESRDKTLMVDVAESSFVSVRTNLVTEHIEATVTRIDPSPNATLESDPPVWSWGRDRTVSISYTVSVSDDIEPGTYTVPVSIREELTLEGDSPERRADVHIAVRSPDADCRP
ncbi:hypothetical protein SVXHr_1433 [Halorhabdus sp. SVX81]|uniref:hypothetical protein n=1 Tax=Halorhabdus sp. SVX81 TaxID=2978283 RepID=UPI0023DB4A5E|nr:hypothetical protein [Halorhabdus sp. SVX81]WEL17602.1 hypothetical protein SVXHr_1433 [Halorhabdus sp. SVX81]